jgi:hypothetical protein
VSSRVRGGFTRYIHKTGTIGSVSGRFGVPEAVLSVKSRALLWVINVAVGSWQAFRVISGQYDNVNIRRDVNTSGR